MGDEKMEKPKHEKAMALHHTLAKVYLALAAFICLIFLIAGGASLKGFILPLIVAVLAAVHWLIALGAARANPVAQVFSVVFALLLLPGFPIGTAIGIYLLLNASWERPNQLRVERAA